MFLYTWAFAKNVDDTLFPDVRKMFQADFGSDLFLVKMADWPGRPTASTRGAGPSHRSFSRRPAWVPATTTRPSPAASPLVRKRDDGQFYRFAWSKILRLPATRRPWLVHLETWNEFHEGTDICESAEYGRKYIELSRRNADLFHAGKTLSASETPGTQAVVSATPEKSRGIAAVDKSADDGPVVQKTVADKHAWSTTQNRHAPDARYMYFDVDYAFLDDGDETLELTVTYFDDGPEAFLVEYDSADPQLKGLSQKFRPTPQQKMVHTRAWKEATFHIAPRRVFPAARTAATSV